ncbi:Uncharacterized protein Rs2_12441 [Raphanus sativus]|nr:Uncharacterized protein Rs2_12441 [Raphanus sativus]
MINFMSPFQGLTSRNTVHGMIYCREALKLQAFLDMADDEVYPVSPLDILEGYVDAERKVGELRWSKKSSVAAYTNLDENKISWEKEEALILTLISVARTLILNSLREAQCSVEEGLIYFCVIMIPEEDALLCEV